MPKAESPKHTKAPEDPTRPVSPHRVAIPPTPAAAARSDPIDTVKTSPSTSPKRSLEKDKENTPKPSAAPASKAARAASEAPEPRPEPISPASAVKSAQPSAGNKEVTPPSKPPIDMEIFGQILELDDDPEDREFSKSIVDNYFEQVVATFKDMDDSIKANDLLKLSNLGHFLKGSSAALGVWKVQATCEIIQHVGKLRPAGDQPVSLTKKEAIERLKELKSQAEEEYEEAKKWLEDHPGGD
ncbi:hypothetical protein M407DRAFT_26685 [Tulasnella calospora MUT 4182]|uniref:HPt domain-containing protein n=1 Tax=Tulasnella calospora MUT 4182 TaxID=1051891 RepID=A0A0C3Q4K4_9AGAM|nr:hypothetical protein M407DRAFT_26685 [Tulasnella calospora MUT 4182]